MKIVYDLVWGFCRQTDKQTKTNDTFIAGNRTLKTQDAAITNH